MNSEDWDRELHDLWRRCASTTASEGDWRQLYQLVHQVLLRCNAPELAGLSDNRQTYIDEFFSQKVFLAMKPSARGPDHCGALILFFRRYLRDNLRSDNRLISESTNEREAEETSEIGVGDLERLLPSHCGVTLEHVTSCATEFLDDLKANDEWAWLMLRYNFFPDKEDSIPLSHLAQRHQIPSYHYRAAQLGIKHRCEQGVEQFQKTMLGSWLEKALGTRLSDDQSECVDAAFKILGFVALKG